MYELTDSLKIYSDGREVCRNNAAGKREYASRREQMYDRDHGICCICKRKIWLRSEATFEHTEGRGLGGGHRDDRPSYVNAQGKMIRNGVAHFNCNGMKGGKRG